MRKLLEIITEIINTFSVVNFLKCVVTEVVLFSIVAFKTWTFHKVYSVAIHLRRGGIFSDSNCYQCSPDSDSEISLKIDLYLIKLMRTKVCQFFGPPCSIYCPQDTRQAGSICSLDRRVCLNTVSWNCITLYTMWCNWTKCIKSTSKRPAARSAIGGVSMVHLLDFDLGLRRLVAAAVPGTNP